MQTPSTTLHSHQRSIYIYIYVCVIRERISCTFLPAMCITFRIKRHRDDASSSTEIRLKVDTTRSGEECGESSFDVTTYLLVDRPTHPYKQGLLERNRNNLYPKGLGSDRVSLGYYLPAVRFAVCMYLHTCSWHCHVTRAFSFHANARCMRLLCCFWGINRPRLLATTTACLSSFSVSLSAIAIASSSATWIRSSFEERVREKLNFNLIETFSLSRFESKVRIRQTFLRIL